MDKSSSKESQKYHHFVRVLATLAQLKVASTRQIERHCFNKMSQSFVWDTVKKLRQADLIESKSILNPDARPFSAYFLTSKGFKELALQYPLGLEEIQLKSNSLQHDLVLTDLCLLFSQVRECNYFVSENIIRSKLLEEEVKEMAIFRSARSDSAVLMTVNGQKVWLALEYERSRKSFERYKQRLKSWYQTENLPGVLVVTEDESLAEIMAQIDSKTIPHLPRKVLFLPRNQINLQSKKLHFMNSKKEFLTFSLGESIKQFYPILDQNLARS